MIATHFGAFWSKDEILRNIIFLWITEQSWESSSKTMVISSSVMLIWLNRITPTRHAPISNKKRKSNLKTAFIIPQFSFWSSALLLIYIIWRDYGEKLPQPADNEQKHLSNLVVTLSFRHRSYSEHCNQPLLNPSLDLIAVQPWIIGLLSHPCWWVVDRTSYYHWTSNEPWMQHRWNIDEPLIEYQWAWMQHEREERVHFPITAGWTPNKQFCFSKSAPFRILSPHSKLWYHICSQVVK